MPPILAVEELVKQYPAVRAVDGVSYSIERVSGMYGLLSELPP